MKNTIAQYKGRGNSLNNEYARIMYYTVFYNSYKALQVYLETPSFILSRIYNLGTPPWDNQDFLA